MSKKKLLLGVLCFIYLFTMTSTSIGNDTVSINSSDFRAQKQKIENPYVDVPSAIRNMYNPDLFPDIYMMTQPNCLFTSRTNYEKIQNGEKPGTVASHGSVWNYDTDIPIIFYGKGIKQNYLGGEANLIDIAPTLAYLTGVQRPSAAKGRVLNEIIEPETAVWTSEDRPKVVVLFSLDQARLDYLNVFDDAFSFLKENIIAKGSSFAGGRITHAKTATAVSHSSVGTGTIPGIHGVLGNNVIQPDDTFPLTIDDGNRTDYGHGDLSPHNLLVPTLADELDRRYSNKSIIVSSSSYARAAIGVAGHGAYYDGSDYAYEGADKDFVFSCNRYAGVPYTNTDYYALPDYLNAETNSEIHVKNWLKKYYNLDIESTPWTQDLTLMDTTRFSASDEPIGHASAQFPWDETYTFNHPLIDNDEVEPDMLQSFQNYREDETILSKKYYNSSISPFLDLWNIDLNLLIMDNEKVGQDNVPDLVFCHIKSLDIVGHNYGIYSGEIYNYMFFADYMIKKVIKWLNENVGENQYTCVFFSDHGANNVTNNGTWIVKEDVTEAMEAQFGVGIIKKMSGDQIWIDHDILESSGNTLENVAAWMENNFTWAMKAYTSNQVRLNTPNYVNDASAVFNENHDISIPNLDVFGTMMPIILKKYSNPNDPIGYYWKFQPQN